ncbi:MAG: hypothetical protein HND27_06460 [Bacteroidetes bacterium]|nr:hypothetical protein [Bacteroidota bacterium]WKZ76345.1 MAG: hypothetical protein QY303_05480 [Vicingaceae bacterium]GIK69692.1 MAG: hypothetical protein BroJett020_09870 [Bacteroidota bacterium]
MDLMFAYLYVFSQTGMSGLVKPYRIVFPPIKSGSVFTFTTDTGIFYEVRFGRKQNDILSATIVFGVTNDEFEGEEYSETNKGEVYKVMSTIVLIVLSYMQEHPNIHTYEFTGEPKKQEDSKKPTVRIKLYTRYIRQVFDKQWGVTTEGNRIIISRKK